jgi:hypothetical protein
MSRFNIEKARQLGLAIRAANKALADYLALHFPKGYRCDVLLNARQKNPTPATIWYVEGGVYGGSIAVEIDNAKQYSRYRIRRLPPEQVLNVRPATPADESQKGGAA